MAAHDSHGVLASTSQAPVARLDNSFSFRSEGSKRPGGEGRRDNLQEQSLENENKKLGMKWKGLNDRSQTPAQAVKCPC